MTLFIRAVAAEDKAEAIKLALSGSGNQTFSPKLSSFKELPGTPFSYWVGAGIRRLFAHQRSVEGDGRSVRQGLATADDFRFLRATWEVPPATRGVRWFPFAKGGELSPFYAPLHLVVNWALGGREIKHFVDLRSGKVLSRPQNEDFYFRKGLTWPLRASRFAPQPLPVGCIFSVRGYSVFLPDEDLRVALALFNSKAFDYIFKALLGRFAYPEFIVGILKKLPWPEPTQDQKNELTSLATLAWSVARAPHTSLETSVDFVLPPLLNRTAKLAAEKDLAHIQRQIDAIALDVLALDQNDAAEIDAAGIFRSSEQKSQASVESEEPAPEDDLTSLISWAVGVAFGRFDIRLALGQREIPTAADPFEAISPISPGMRPPNVDPFHPMTGILVDDNGHPDDLPRIVAEIVDAIGVDQGEKLGALPLRSWLASGYFSTHIEMYSKSGRKAPIWWQLSTPSAGYSTWLSYHELTSDTLYRTIHEYVRPKLAHEQANLEAARADADASGRVSEELSRLSASVEELKSMVYELERVAPLWGPDQDDGVVINFAPLWRLVPQNRPWQKVVREVWDELCDGKYDWAHLAMRLWPERVVVKCAVDHSLAIAHGLEDVFWFEDDNGKWKPRKTPLRPIQELVAERTSSAVKDALKSLLEAPEPVAPAKRGRKAKAS